jgi:hypothetical protein
MAVASRPDTEKDHTALAVWRTAVGCFILAALTGALFRFATGYGLGPDRLAGLDLGNIRHAHSHLMYFGWATPGLMLLIVQVLRQRGAAVRGAGPVLFAVFVFALLAFPPFLLFGYSLAPVGGRELPLSMIAAGINVIGWYGFVVVYVVASRGMARDAALRMVDVALGLLVLSTFGAWALAASVAMNLDNAVLTAALVHFFLDLFGEGWFVLGVLALGVAQVRQPGVMPRWPVALLALGVPFTFVLALPAGALGPGWRLAGGFGGLMVGAALLAAVAHLWPRLRSPGWRVALVCLALKAGGQVLVALTPVDWSGLIGLRVLYLHLMLLGFVSVGLVAASRVIAGLVGRGGEIWFAVAVVVMLASLVPLTALWPAALAGLWAYRLAAWVALAPILVALALLAGRHPGE